MPVGQRAETIEVAFRGVSIYKGCNLFQRLAKRLRTFDFGAIEIVIVTLLLQNQVWVTSL